MLQHKWTIHQGNAACLSVWPGQRDRLRPGHPLSTSEQFVRCVCFVGTASVCVCVCPCVSYTLGQLHWRTNAGSCSSYFGEVFVVALVGALKVVTHIHMYTHTYTLTLQYRRNLSHVIIRCLNPFCSQGRQNTRAALSTCLLAADKTVNCQCDCVQCTPVSFVL